MSLKDWKKIAFGLGERTRLLDLLQRSGNEANRRLYVLMYHRVDDPGHRPGLDPGQISAFPGQLEEQFRLIAAKYHPVSAEEVLEAIAGRQHLPRGAVLVTVDDGYRDFAEVIFPAALRHGIRPVLFVPTAFIGQGHFWWDKLYAVVFSWPEGRLLTPLGNYPLGNQATRHETLQALVSKTKKIPFDEGLGIVDELFNQIPDKKPWTQRSTLDWDELRELDRQGATIAAHTHTHPLLSRIPFERARAEICLSQEHVRRELGHALPVFAFPDGKLESFTPELIEFLRGEGFQFVLSTIEGSATLSAGRALCFPRLAVWPGLELAAFHFHLTPFYKIR